MDLFMHIFVYSYSDLYFSWYLKNLCRINPLSFFLPPPQVMGKARLEHNTAPAPPSMIPEYRLWEDHWIRCAKELNQWDIIQEFASTKGNTNPHLVLESAWRIPNWSLMKDALAQVSKSLNHSNFISFTFCNYVEWHLLKNVFMVSIDGTMNGWTLRAYIANCQAWSMAFRCYKFNVELV